MDKQKLDATASTRDAIAYVIEALQWDTNYDSISAYKKRELTRRLYSVAKAGVRDAQEVVSSFLQTIEDVKAEASFKFQQEDGNGEPKY